MSVVDHTHPAVQRPRPQGPARRGAPRYAVLLVPAAIALLAGLDAALQLMELPTPISSTRLPDLHGPLLVLGFLGTLIALERAMALGRAAGQLAPALLGMGALLLLSPVPLRAGQSLLVAGTATVVAVYVPLWRRQRVYLGAQGRTDDADKVDAEQPDAVVLNGYANKYDHRPLPARVGERVRVWVLDAGPNRATSFHVVGGQFDTVYAEGAYLLRRGHGGSQSLALQPAQGGFVELTFPEAGGTRSSRT